MKCTSKNLLFGFGLVVVCTVLAITLCWRSVSSQERPQEIKPVTADIKSPLTQHCKGTHTTKDFYKNARMLPPSTILEIVGNRLNYATASDGIELGSFDLEPGYSVTPKDFATNHSGCYGIIYCEKHLVVHTIDLLDSKHCHLTKS